MGKIIMGPITLTHDVNVCIYKDLKQCDVCVVRVEHHLCDYKKDLKKEKVSTSH